MRMIPCHGPATGDTTNSAVPDTTPDWVNQITDEQRSIDSDLLALAAHLDDAELLNNGERGAARRKAVDAALAMTSNTDVSRQPA